MAPFIHFVGELRGSPPTVDADKQAAALSILHTIKSVKFLNIRYNDLYKIGEVTNLKIAR